MLLSRRTCLQSISRSHPACYARITKASKHSSAAGWTCVLYRMENRGQSRKGLQKRGHRFLVMIFEMACRIVVPAFSISFLVRPIVRQIFIAGVGL